MSVNACIAIMVFAAGVMLLPAAAIAQAPKGKAAPAAGDKGVQWETTMKMEMAGFAMPAQTHRVCLAADAGSEQMVPASENCRVTESRQTGNTVRFKMVCTGRDAMTGDGEITTTRDGYNGRMKMVSKEGEMLQTFSGRRLGECTGTVQAQARDAQAKADAAKAQSCQEGIKSLVHQMYFGQGAACTQKDQFCAEVSKHAASMQSPTGYTAGRRRGTDLKASFAACGQDLEATTRAACRSAVASRGWSFVGGGDCDPEVPSAAKLYCTTGAGKSPDPEFFPLCSRYATLTRGAATAGAAAPASASPPAAAPAPSPTDPVKSGLDAVRKIFPF